MCYLAALSVKPERLMLEGPRFLFHPTFERYRLLFGSGPPAGDLATSGSLAGSIWNSLLTSLLGIVGSLVLGGLCAFGFAFLRFRARGPLFFTMLLTRMFPPVTTLIPIYLLLRILGLVDTRLALVLLFAGFQIPLVLWILRTYLQGIPQDLIDSAALDGASLPVIASRIVLPLATPGLISAAILGFIFNWNEFLFPLIVTAYRAKPGTVAIMNYTEQQLNVQWGSLAVVGVVMTLPVILFMLGLRTYLIKGLTIGSVRG